MLQRHHCFLNMTRDKLYANGSFFFFTKREESKQTNEHKQHTRRHVSEKSAVKRTATSIMLKSFSIRRAREATYDIYATSPTDSIRVVFQDPLRPIALSLLSSGRSRFVQPPPNFFFFYSPSSQSLGPRSRAKVWSHFIPTIANNNNTY